jgi:hypothetical protein
MKVSKRHHGVSAIAFVTSVACLATEAAETKLSCPAGQLPATRIDYQGKYNPDPTADAMKIRELVPNVGYTSRTVIVAKDFYKESSVGKIAVLKEKGPGKPVQMPGAPSYTLFASELPSRFVILETPTERMTYDEQGDPAQAGRRVKKSARASAEERRLLAGGLQATLASSADKAQVMGEANYAGIACTVRKFLTAGATVCVARVQGQDVTLAQESKDPTTGERQWMQATKQSQVCVAKQEFAPPASVRFKAAPAPAKAPSGKQAGDDFFDAAAEDASGDQ